MKINSMIRLALMAAGTAATATISMAQIVNGGFETDAVLDASPVSGATGWTTFGPVSTTSANGDPARSGIGSLRFDATGGFGVPGAFQILPASPGQLWSFQGYLLSPNGLPADSTFGLLKIVWSDGVSDLQPGTVTVGNGLSGGFPGIESTPFLNSSSTPGVWHFSEAAGYAPAGTTEVRLFLLDVDQSPNTIYFDDISAAPVPEAGTHGLIVLGLLGVVRGFRQRRA